MDWSQISAVKNHRAYNRAYKIPLGVYAWSPANAERALLLKWAAKRNLPEKFKDIDMSELVADFYKGFFEYDLSQTEIEKLLHAE